MASPRRFPLDSLPSKRHSALDGSTDGNQPSVVSLENYSSFESAVGNSTFVSMEGGSLSGLSERHSSSSLPTEECSTKIPSEKYSQTILATDGQSNVNLPCKRHSVTGVGIEEHVPSGKVSDKYSQTTFLTDISVSLSASSSERCVSTTYFTEGFSLSEEIPCYRRYSPPTTLDAEEHQLTPVRGSPTLLVDGHTSSKFSESYPLIAVVRKRHSLPSSVPLSGSPSRDYVSCSPTSDSVPATLSAEKHSSIKSPPEKPPPTYVRRRGSIASVSEVTRPVSVRVQRRKSLGSPSELGSFLASFTRRRSIVSPTENISPLESLPEVDPPPALTTGSGEEPPVPSTDKISSGNASEGSQSPTHERLGMPPGGHFKRRPLFVGSLRHRRRWSLPDISWIQERIGKFYPRNHLQTQAQVG